MKAESLFREICRPCPSRLTSKVISSRGNPTSWIVPDAAAKAKSQFFLARSAKPWVLFRNSSLSALTTTSLKSSSSFWRKKAIKSMSCHWESKDILQCFHFQHSRTTPSVSKLFINTPWSTMQRVSITELMARTSVIILSNPGSTRLLMRNLQRFILLLIMATLS